MGQAPPVGDPVTDILIFDPLVCQDAVDEGYRSNAGMWVANYGEARLGAGPSPFGVNVVDGILTDIMVGSPDLTTAEGIGRLSSRADLLAAYPDGLEIMPDWGGDTDVYRLAGASGNLYFDVLKSSSVEYYPEVGAELVVRVIVTRSGHEPAAGFNSDYYLGACVTA